MGMYEGLLDQLEDAIGGGSLSRRADVLRRVTDLFMSASGSFSEPQLELFDEVMTRLAEGVELAARASFGSRLATAVDAPLNVIRMLAFDQAIEVAGPVLAQICTRYGRDAGRECEDHEPGSFAGHFDA